MLLVGAHDDNAFGWQDVEAIPGDCRLDEASHSFAILGQQPNNSRQKGGYFRF